MGKILGAAEFIHHPKIFEQVVNVKHAGISLGQFPASGINTVPFATKLPRRCCKMALLQITAA